MASSWAIRFLSVAIGMMALIALQPAHAGEQPIDLPVCIAPANVASTPAAALRANYNCSTEQYRHGPGDYWARSAPIPAAASKGEIHVRVNSLWQRGLTLHAIYTDGGVATIRTGSDTLSHHVQLGAIFDFVLPQRSTPVERLLWRVDGASNARGVLLGQRIVSERFSDRANIGMAALYASFGGLALALLVYNLALWGALRHRFQLAYCAMVAVMMVYAFSSSASLAWAFPAIDNNDRIRINYLTLAFAGAAAILFARTFFEAHIFGPRLRRACTAAIILLTANGALFWALSYLDMLLADRIYSWVFVAGLAVTAAILWQAWRLRSNYLWLFAIAWGAPILFSVARILAALHLLPQGFWIDNSTVLTLAFESLVSSIAISYRVQLLTRERDEALAGEALARALADADPLTGLMNRRAFLATAIGRSGPQTFHLIDIDHFKSVNDTLGHDGGDEVLRAFARALRTITPAGALVARVGGEEFALLTDGSASIDPERVLTRLRATRMPFDLTVTASIGSCTGPLATERDWKRLYNNADRALFDAKAAGRDRARRALSLAVAA